VLLVLIWPCYFGNRWNNACALWIDSIYQARWDHGGLHNNFLHKLGVRNIIKAYLRIYLLRLGLILFVNHNWNCLQKLLINKNLILTRS